MTNNTLTDLSARLAWPSAWTEPLSGRVATRQTIGRSNAVVWRLEQDGALPLFVKVEIESPLAEAPGEAARLRWLAAQDVPCPGLLGNLSEDGLRWLLMTAVPGRDLASSPDIDPAAVVELVAAALRDLHDRGTDGCPFDHSLDARLQLARARMEAGRVDEDDFDDERQGRTAEELFEVLLAGRPGDEAPVLTHGDACLPNLMSQAGRFTGFVDCGRVGLADRHQDIALAAGSLDYNLGAGWGERFLGAYGGPVDPERLAYYRLLDEFF